MGDSLAEVGVFRDVSLALLGDDEEDQPNMSPMRSLEPAGHLIQDDQTSMGQGFLHEECERLMAQIQTLGLDEKCAEVERTGASEELAFRLRRAVEALLHKFKTVREEAKSCVSVAVEARQSSEKECALLRERLSQAPPVLDLEFSPPQRTLSKGSINEEEDHDSYQESFQSPTSDHVDAMQENRALRRECRQLRKEVAGAVEWERSARKATEAKQGLLKVHEALLHESKNHCNAEHQPSVSGEEVQRLRQAVVRAADAEEEARELLAAKQEMLAEAEARLYESDRQRLENVVTSVENSLSAGTRRLSYSYSPTSAGEKGGPVWHVLVDD